MGAAAAAKLLQSCPTLCDLIDGSPPGSPVPGILQARTLEWVAISFSNAWKWKVKIKSLSPPRLLGTPRTAAHQAPPSMGFSRQEYWSGVPCVLLEKKIEERKQKKKKRNPLILSHLNYTQLGSLCLPNISFTYIQSSPLYIHHVSYSNLLVLSSSPSFLFFIVSKIAFTSQGENIYIYHLKLGLPWWLSSKESAFNAGDTGDMGSIPGLERIPWSRKWQPNPVFLPGESHGLRSLADYSPWRFKKPDTTEWLSIDSNLSFTVRPKSKWMQLKVCLSVIEVTY